MRPADRQVLVIAGAEKCGTTSLFGYLSRHPAIRASRHKETDHFRSPDATADGFWQCFDGEPPAGGVYLEASPGYMAEAASVAPRIHAALPQAKLIFVLRDPVDRLRSAFGFYKSRLHVPQDMTLDDFVDRCLRFERSPNGGSDGILPWHLLALDRGRYERQIEAFESRFRPDSLLLLEFDDLRADARGTALRAASFAGLDVGEFPAGDLARENVTFQVRRPGLQRMALRVNDGFEPFWRRHPALKQKLLATYRRFNARPKTAEAMSPQTAERLAIYYAATHAFLAHRFRGSPRPSGASPTVAGVPAR